MYPADNIMDACFKERFCKDFLCYTRIYVVLKLNQRLPNVVELLVR